MKQGDRVTLRDFGTFYNAEKRGKRYYDIHTGEIKTYPNKKVIKFVPYKKFKEQLLFNVLDTHIVNDGSIGNSIVVGRYIYYNPTHYTDIKRINNTNLKPTLGKENIARRVIRKPKLETINLSFEGHFLFDHFLGENEHTEYPSLKVSKKNTPILVPQVDKTGVTIGVMEPILLAYLVNMCKEIDGVKVLKSVKLPILNRNYSYRPDFCLYWEREKLYIDIEIDEPYDIVSRKPIHYEGNSDNLRDRYFIRNGWCVIRFAEQQVKDNIEGVVNHIKRVLRWLTDESRIKIHEETLSPIKRWSYEEATTMSLNNIREHYLELKDNASLGNHQTMDIDMESTQNAFAFMKPDEDILPETTLSPNELKWEKAIDELKKSNIEHCILTRTNGYQWIYTCKSLHIQSTNGVNCIAGQSPLETDIHIPLDDIETLVPLKELFSNVYWEYNSSMSLKDLNTLGEILFDAIANGKPIWISYHSNNSGRSTRFLSNIVYSWSSTSYFTPHIGLGHCKKHGIRCLSHFHAYCSNRKEFRCFAADGRIEKLKVLNCSHVYFFKGEYAKSFAHLVMSPYESNNGNAFFENADEILHIMPQNEFKSAFVQGNLANLQVLKGEIDKAILTYKQKPYDFFITPTLTWGEICLSDIKFFIDLCNKHLNDSHFYEGLDANILLHNFEEVLRQLMQSSWMQDNT